MVTQIDSVGNRNCMPCPMTTVITPNYQPNERIKVRDPYLKSEGEDQKKEILKLKQ